MALVDVYVIPVVDGVAYGLLLFVVAAGLTVAYGVGDVLNLAHGTLYALGAYTAAVISRGSWVELGLALVVGAVAGAAGGGVLAGLVAPIAGRGPLDMALLTMGVALAGGQLLTAVFGADELPVVLPAGLDGAVTAAGHRYPLYRLGFIGLAIVLAVASHAVVSRSRAGRVVRAAVDDRTTVACLGINPGAVRTGVLAAAGGLAAVGGVLGAPIIGPGPRTADMVLLASMVIVVVGGLGSIRGALLAAIAVGEVQTLGVTLAPTWAPYLLYAAAVAALATRSWRTGTVGGRA